MNKSLTYPKIRGRILELYGNMENFSKRIGFSRISVSFKLNRRTKFSTRDITLWADALNISPKEIPVFFELGVKT